MELSDMARPSRNMKTIYVPDDVELDTIIRKAAAILQRKGVSLKRYAGRNKPSDSVVIIAALQHLIDSEDPQ